MLQFHMELIPCQSLKILEESVAWYQLLNSNDLNMTRDCSFPLRPAGVKCLATMLLDSLLVQ